MPLTFKFSHVFPTTKKNKKLAQPVLIPLTTRCEESEKVSSTDAQLATSCSGSRLDRQERWKLANSLTHSPVY